MKFETPDELKIKGRAVLEGGVHTPEAFAAWRTQHPAEGIIEWMP